MYPFEDILLGSVLLLINDTIELIITTIIIINNITKSAIPIYGAAAANADFAPANAAFDDALRQSSIDRIKESS